jgi:hypothetical protein
MLLSGSRTLDPHSYDFLIDVKIPQSGKYYIGATSQPLKKRMAGHLQDTRKLQRRSSQQYPGQSSGTDVAAKQQLSSIRWHVA